MLKNLFTATLLAFAAAAAATAEDERGDGKIYPYTVQGPHAKMMVVPVAREEAIAFGNDRSKGLVTIFSSLASKYPKGVYWCCTGYNVMGSNSGVGEQWMAGAFTPKADHTLTEIEVGVGYSGQGPNGVVISVNEDNGGIPGKALKKWKANNLTTFGTCCRTVTEKDAAGIPLTGGNQYWVVLSTDSKQTDTVDGWNVSDADQVDQATTASWDGSTWHVFQTAPGVAFAVRGN